MFDVLEGLPAFNALSHWDLIVSRSTQRKFSMRKSPLKIALLGFVLFVSVGINSVVAADPVPFITEKDLDLVWLLPPPPAGDSPQTRQELGEVLTLQVTRTPEMAARAAADATENIWRFEAVMGPKFRKEALPKLDAFFARVFATEDAVVDPAKLVWKRLRPHQMSDLVRPSAKLSNSGAWPSGHAASGTLAGITLARMVPEKRTDIMARAWEYGDNRVVGGLHYRSDIEAGRIAGAVIAEAVFNRDDFKREYEEARSELRRELGL